MHLILAQVVGNQPGDHSTRAFHSLPCCPVFRLSFVSLESSMETWSQWQRKWSFCPRCCRSRLWASRFVNSVDTLRSFSKASRFGCRAWRMQIRYNLTRLYHSCIAFFLVFITLWLLEFAWRSMSTCSSYLVLYVLRVWKPWSMKLRPCMLLWSRSKPHSPHQSWLARA